MTANEWVRASAIEGPAIIEEWTSTARLSYPDQQAEVDAYGNLIIKRAKP